MTTNLNAIAGPSKLTPSPRIDPDSPSSVGSEMKEISPSVGLHSSTSGTGINKPGLSMDENGEVVKVPAFLQKLYSMVSDPATDNLIYWSESGDSFFVPNHERFGKEILPRFFKHSNFSSFVRQLNMYGFHKVPQPQTGVLKADNPNDSELWEFINPFFKRGHSHLLSKVMRKNNRPNVPPPPAAQPSGTRSSARQASQANAPYGSQYLITDGSTEGEAGPLIGANGQQLIDLSAITSGIAAIQRTQASIGADLKALQASNEHLWREAIESRDRHQKHQETIDLIVTFLERLFGTEGEGLKGLKEALRRGGIGRPRENSTDEEQVGKKRKRLGLDRMISDGRNLGAEGDDQIIEIQEEPSDDPFNHSLPRLPRTKSAPSTAGTDKWSSSSQRFQPVPSDDESSPRNKSGSSSRTATPSSANPFAGFTPNNPNNVNPAALIPYFQNQSNQNNTSDTPADPNNNSAATPGFNLDPALLQTTIGSLLQSPAAAQMFLNSLNNSAQGQALQTPTKGLDNGYNQPMLDTQLNGLNNNNNNNYFADTPDLSALSQSLNGLNDNTNPNIDPTLALFSPLPNYNALSQNNEALLKSYTDALGVGTDVEKLQESIDSLVRSMGLDVQHQNQAPPTNLPGQNAQAPVDNTSGLGDLSGLGGQDVDGGLNGLDAEFNVDEFLERLGKDEEEV